MAAHQPDEGMYSIEVDTAIGAGSGDVIGFDTATTTSLKGSHWNATDPNIAGIAITTSFGPEPYAELATGRQHAIQTEGIVPVRIANDSTGYNPGAVLKAEEDTQLVNRGHGRNATATTSVGAVNETVFSTVTAGGVTGVEFTAWCLEAAAVVGIGMDDQADVSAMTNSDNNRTKTLLRIASYWVTPNA